VTQRLAAAITLAVAVGVMLVASSQPQPASRPASPAGAAAPFARHPRVARPDRALLRQAGGWIWWTDEHCHAKGMNLITLRTREAEGLHCRIWPNPQGSVALATVGSPAEAASERRLAVIDLFDPRAVREIATVHHQEGLLASPVSWRADGRAAAFCITTQYGTAVIRVSAGDLVQREIRGVCDPAWVNGTRLAVTRKDEVLVGGRALPLGRELARVTHGAPATITALAAEGERLAIGVARSAQFGRLVPPMSLVVSDTSGSASISVRPGESGPFNEVGIAPDGHAAWYLDPDTGRASLAPGLRSGGYPVDIPRTAFAYAWSPDGRFLAVAAPRDVRLFDWRTGETATISFVSARTLAWVR
jgi:hypothetical protein